MIAATDFLARSFTWKLPGAGAARGLGLAALQALGAGQVGARAADDVRLRAERALTPHWTRRLDGGPMNITDLDAHALSRAIHAQARSRAAR